MIKSKYDQSAIITEKGSAFIWPIQISTEDSIMEPFELAFNIPKISIACVSCGKNF